MTEAQVRKKFVDIAISYLGCKESDGSHRKIIDLYNRNTTGYRMKYTDHWCDCYVSAMAIEAGYTSIIPTEVSCKRHIDLFKKIGRWVENDAYRPEPGDILFYDWDDDGKGDNVGNPDHVGIVVSVTGNDIKIIEGNRSNMVKYCTIEINGRYIRGYGVPDFAKLATEGMDTNNDTPYKLYTVVAGDTLSRIAQKYGTTYQQLALYNNIDNPNLIFVGQQIRIPTADTDDRKVYIVQKGDTLSEIALEQLGRADRWHEIQKLNNINGTTIYPGQVLILPK